MSTDRVILLKGDPLREELKADAAITPGMLVERTATGCKKHATDSGNAEKLFAIENSLEGQEVGDDYSTGDMAQLIKCGGGEHVQAWLADGESVTYGDPLVSNGAGLLKAAAESEGELADSVIGYARETLDLSATTTLTDTRIRIAVA